MTNKRANIPMARSIPLFSVANPLKKSVILPNRSFVFLAPFPAFCACFFASLSSLTYAFFIRRFVEIVIRDCSFFPDIPTFPVDTGL